MKLRISDIRTIYQQLNDGRAKTLTELDRETVKVKKLIASVSVDCGSSLIPSCFLLLALKCSALSKTVKKR